MMSFSNTENLLKRGRSLEEAALALEMLLNFQPFVACRPLSCTKRAYDAANMLHVIEECRVAPPSGSVANQSFPVTFFDLWWIHQAPIKHLLFFEFPNSESHFKQTTIPKLKHSLSLALKHFYPLAGSFIFPLDSSKPEIRYVNGDSIPVTFVESSNDLNHLTGHHARNAIEFYPLVPKLPPVSELSHSISIPLLAIQVTLFPNTGICIGYVCPHVATDGRSILDFIKIWGLITKLGGDETLLGTKKLPLIDRSVIKDPKEIGTKYWNEVRKIKFDSSKAQIHPTNNVWGSFVMDRTNVEELKKWVITQCPTLPHVSTFAVTSAYIWTCLVKARAKIEDVCGEELEHFCFAADCRGRLSPRVPKNYFGNCLVGCVATIKSTELVGPDGLILATKVIGEAFHEKMYNDEGGPLKGWETVVSDLAKFRIDRTLSVAGSTTLGFYQIDFGWGRPKKSEIVSIDGTGAMSLTDSIDVGNVEVGLSLPRIKMDAFAKNFADGL